MSYTPFRLSDAIDYIRQLESKIGRLETEVKSLKDRITDYGWKEDMWRDAYEWERRQDGW